MTLDKMTAYDNYGVPYRFAVVRRQHGVYNVTIDGNFYATAESRREAEDEISAYVADYGLSYVKPF